MLFPAVVLLGDMLERVGMGTAVLVRVRVRVGVTVGVRVLVRVG